MNGGHTPGPWKMSPSSPPPSPAAAICLPRVIGDVRNYGSQEEADANARLIASAPELLEAWVDWFDAAKILAELERRGDTTKRFDDALWAQECAENKARAAIAKATGQ